MCPGPNDLTCAMLLCCLPVGVGSLNDEWGDYITFVGAIPGYQPMARIGLLNGIPYAKYHEYQCDLGTTDLAYGAASSDYEVPILHREQHFAKASLYLNSEGDDGRHLFGFSQHEPTHDFLVPHTLKMIQADGMNSDVLYGIATGSCLGSMHVGGKTATFSVCGYRKSDGYEWEIYSFTGETEGNMEVDITMSAFDPIMRTYYFYGWGGPSDPHDYLVETNVDDGTISLYQVPDELEGTVESLVHDHKGENPRLYSSRIQNGTNIMYAIERNLTHPGATPPRYVPMADFSLDEQSRQEFALLGGFEGNLGGNREEFARYFSLLYEHGWHQHEMRKTTFSKDLPGDGGDNSVRRNLPMEVRAGPLNLSHAESRTPVKSEYVLFADVVGMAISNMYVGPDPAAEDSIAYIRSCHGKHCTKVGSHIDKPGTPSIIFLGEFNKMTLENQTLPVDITVDDLDTPLRQLQLHIESSNPNVVRDSDIEEVRPENSSSVHAWKERRLLIHPRPGARGLARLTIFVTDGQDSTKASFAVFVGKNATECAALETHDDGCEYMAVSDEVDTTKSRVVYDQEFNAVQENGLVAGNSLLFTIQSVNRFNYDLTMEQDFRDPPVFNADISSAEHMHDASENQLMYRGEGGKYVITTSPLLQTGVWVTHVRGWDGQPISNDQFSILVTPAALDAANLEITGPGAKSARQGRQSELPDGNRLLVTAFDRFKNRRTGGGDSFGISPREWKAEWNETAFAATVTDTSDPAMYSIVLWFGDGIYDQKVWICASAGASTEVGHSVCDEDEANTEMEVYVVPRIFYLTNGVGKFESKQSYLFYTEACPPANPEGPILRWNGTRGALAGGSGAPEEECWRAEAGFEWSGLYVQSVDEFGTDVQVQDYTASSSIVASTISETLEMDATANPQVRYHTNGIYNVSITFSMAGWQPVFVLAVDELLPGSPYMVFVEPGVLSPAVSYCVGDGIVMATSGTPETVAGGNHFFIECRDRFGNRRIEGNDMFLLDPLEDKNAFKAAITRWDVGCDPEQDRVTDDNTHGTPCWGEDYPDSGLLPGDRLRVTYWWASSFVQKFEVCPEWDFSDPYGPLKTVPFQERGVAWVDPEDTVGAFRNCLRLSDGTEPDSDVLLPETQAWHARIGCGSECYNETRMIGSRLAPAMVLEVYMRENQGSPITSAEKSGLICLNNIQDDNACYMRHGKAGSLSSFTIEAKNEMSFPNFRGGDDFRVNVEPAPTLVSLCPSGQGQEQCRRDETILATVNYLRIQFYEVTYTPVVAGEYYMHVQMLNMETMVWDAVGSEGTTYYTVVVSPGDAHGPHTTFEMVSTIVCGTESLVSVTVKDLYNNSLTDTVMAQTEARINVRIVTDGASWEFPAIPHEDTSTALSTGLYESTVRTELMGLYSAAVVIQTPCTENCRALWDDTHVHGSPTSVELLAAPFSPADTNITDYISTVIAASDLSFSLQTQDEFGNAVPETGLTVQLDWISSGAVGGVYPCNPCSPGVDLGAGAYRMDFSAEASGPYTYRMRIGEGNVELNNRFAQSDTPTSLFDFLVLPGPAARGQVSGPGVLGASAGIQTTFSLTVQDQFGNVRDDRELVNILFADENDVNITNAFEELIVGTGLTAESEQGLVGQYSAEYTLTQAGRYRLHFFVTGQPLAGRGDWSAAERAEVALTGTRLQVDQLSGNALEPFSVIAGFLDRPSLIYRDEDKGSGAVIARAGLGLVFEVQLLDFYANPRLLNDAQLTFVVKRSAGATYVTLTPDQIDYLAYEYSTDGRYTVTVQLNTAGRYRVYVRVQDLADEAAATFPPVRQDLVTCSGEGADEECFTTMMVQAGYATVSNCVAGQSGIMNTLATSAVPVTFPIVLYDHFDNLNSLQGALPDTDENYLDVTVELVGGTNPSDQSSTVVPGEVIWDSTAYRVTYEVTFAGSYDMTISISGEVLLSISINVIAGPVDPSECTASGVGLLRTEPEVALYDPERETPWTPSVVAVRVRDTNRNNVNNMASIRQLFTVHLMAEGDDTPLSSCALEYSFTNEGNGNLALEYSLSYDPGFDAAPGEDENPLSGTGGLMCGGLQVNYDDTPYRLAVLFNGQDIVGSPFTVKVGRYKPPDHSAYVTSCTSTCDSFRDTPYRACTSVSSTCPGGPREHRYAIADATIPAGTVSYVRFQNVYRTGYPGCEDAGAADACETLVDDYSAEQIDQTTNARADFAAVVVDRSTGSSVDVGSNWYNHATLANSDNGLYTLQFEINVAGEYTVSITVGGAPIQMGLGEGRDCAFNVTVIPTFADPLASRLSGQSASTQVERDSEIRVTVVDEYGNVREDGDDTITMQFSAAQATLTSGPTPEVAFDATTSQYTIIYTVHTCDRTAGFMIQCNGYDVRMTEFAVPCSAGAISDRTEAVSDPDGAARSDISTETVLIAGSTESIKLQAKDQYGNIKRTGGEASVVTAQHVEALGPDGQPAETIPLADRIQDNNDGTYYLSFNVRFLGQSTIGVNVNDVEISNSPYYAQVVAAALFPGTTDAQVPAEAEVGETYTLTIAQRDTFRNVVSEPPAGVYIAFLEGQQFESSGSGAARLLIDLLWQVSGNKIIEVFYRDPSGSVTRVDTINSGTYSIYMSPGEADMRKTRIADDNSYALYADGYQRTQDCVLNQPSIIVIQTIDRFGNTCDEPIADASLFEGFVQPCNGGQGCSTVASTRYDATFEYACPDPADVEACVPGAYRIEFVVEGTGWHKLELRHGAAFSHVLEEACPDPALRGQDPRAASCDTPPFVILSDTAAVPQLCIASGEGLVATVSGNAAQFEITARGGSVANPLPRQGAGDNFVVETGGGAETQGAVGMEYLGSGRYRCTLAAISRDHETRTWPYTVRIRLTNAVTNELEDIAGSPFTATMSPDDTAAYYSLATGQGVGATSRVSSGSVAQLNVYAKDAFNNQVYECVDGFAAQVTFVSTTFLTDSCALEDSHHHALPAYWQYARNGLVDVDTCTPVDTINAEELRATCTSVTAAGQDSAPAQYLLQYVADIAGDYDVSVTFGLGIASELIQRHAPDCQAAGVGPTCTDNPWRVQVMSAGVSARYSFIATAQSHDAQPAESGDFNVTVAGQLMLQYFHALDQYQNRLTQPVCDPISSCVVVSLYWCQQEMNLTSVTADRTDYFTMETRPSEGVSSCETSDSLMIWPAHLVDSTVTADNDNTADGVYAISAMPKRSGAILVAVDADEAGGTVQPADRLFRQVDTDAAVSERTVASPSERSIAEERIEFQIRAHDQFDNFVDDDDLQFSLEIEFVGDSVGNISTTVDYNALDGTYTGMYQVQTGGSAAVIRLFVLLDGTPTNDGYLIRLRAATNKPRFCYAMTLNRGPQETRWHDFSTDLLNEDSKVAGQNLTITVQSMTLKGPRALAPDEVCNATEAADPDATCERLDEFQVEAATTVRGQRLTVQGFGASCHQAPECYNEPGTENGNCNPDDCSRRGWYEVKWQTTISGTYDLSINSLGIVIQQPPREELDERFIPGHDFNQYFPFAVEIYPAAMSASTSTVSVGELLLGEYSRVEVIGRDVYGNRLIADLGESVAMGARLRTACQPTAGSSFELDFQVSYDDNAEHAGTAGVYMSSIKPVYGGPSEVEVYLNMGCFDEMTTYVAHELYHDECHPYEGLRVGGTSYVQIATVGISIVQPNAGHIDGGTRATVPVHGLCDYYEQWEPTFWCNWKSITAGGQIQQQRKPATSLEVDEGSAQQASVVFNLYGASHQTTWRVIRRLGDYDDATYEAGSAGAGQFKYLPYRAGNVWGSTVRGECTDAEPAFLDDTLPATCGELIAGQGCAAQTQEFASAGFPVGTTVSDLCCQSCRVIATESSTSAQIDSAEELWSLPSGPNYAVWLIVDRGTPSQPNGAPLNFTIQDDMGRMILSTVLPAAELTAVTGDDGSVEFLGETRHEYLLNLPSVVKLECDPAPSTQDLTGLESADAQTFDFSVEVAFACSPSSECGSFSELDNQTLYSSVNVRSYFYYPHPTLTELVPQAEALREWDQAYAPISGGMPLIIRGAGFNIGDGAQKDKFLCIFSDRDCSEVNGEGQCAQDEPAFDPSDCTTNVLGELECTPVPGLSISTATYVDNERLYCTCPAVDATGWTSLEISVNSQEVAPDQLYMVYYGLENITSPYISAINGGRDIDLTLVDGPTTLNAWCRFGMFTNADGSIGMPVLDVNGEVVTLAQRVDGTTLRCTTPDASEYNGLIVPNDYTAVCLSFDEGETWSEPSNMIYYAQPAIQELFPPLTITQGGTLLHVELLAGEAYNTAEHPAYDFSAFADALVPTCMFRQDSTRDPNNRRGAPEVPAIFEIVQKPYPPNHPRAGQMYEAQQVKCTTPSHSIPGSNLYVEVSLDNGTSYNYESFAQATDAPALKYYAETSIITEQTASDTQEGYLAAPFFRMRASENSGRVEVRFQYSCGYSPTYGYLVRCRFEESPESPEVITEAFPGTLVLGADSVNKVDCVVPAQERPTRKPLAIALNGVDFTGVTSDTIYVWFGQAIAIRGGFVRSVTDSDRQMHFTARADYMTGVDLIVVEIIDDAGNYVSEDAVYQSAQVDLQVQLIAGGGNRTTVYQSYSNLERGATFFQGISLLKPKVGNYEAVIEVAGLDVFYLPITIIQGLGNITNCVISDTLRQELNVTNGLPFVFHINSRDSADNSRIEGGEQFRVRTTMLEASDAPADLQARFGNPYVSKEMAVNATLFPVCGKDKYSDGRQITAYCDPFPYRVSQYGTLPGAEHVRDDLESCCYGYDHTKVPRRVLAASGDHRELQTGTNFIDLNNGKYRGEIVMTTQQQPDGTLVPLWGRYRLDIEGLVNRFAPEDDESWEPILSSPVYAELRHIDCAYGGFLRGAVLNEFGDQCECMPGWQEKESGQEEAQGSLVHVVCEMCPQGKYGPLPTAPIWTGDQALVPIGTGTHDFGAGVTMDGKYVIESRQGNARTRTTYSHNLAPGEHMCIPCPHNQHTLAPMAYNVSQCLCKEGYYDHTRYELKCVKTKETWWPYNDGVVLNSDERDRRHLGDKNGDPNYHGRAQDPHYLWAFTGTPYQTDAPPTTISDQVAQGTWPGMVWPGIVHTGPNDDTRCLTCNYESGGGSKQYDCFTCFGNDTIAIRPGWWAYNNDNSYDETIQNTKRSLEADVCGYWNGEYYPVEPAFKSWPLGYKSSTLGLRDQEDLDKGLTYELGCLTWARAKSSSFWSESMEDEDGNFIPGPEKEAITAYKCPSCNDIDDDVWEQKFWNYAERDVLANIEEEVPHCTCTGGFVVHPEPGHVPARGANGCKEGNAGAVTCGACSVNWRKGEQGCDPCPEYVMNVNYGNAVFGGIFFASCVWCLTKALGLMRQADLLLLKIFMSFGQCVQSFSVTYTITWPPELAYLYSLMKPLNIDVFEFAGADCVFPELKSFYLKFTSTVLVAPAFMLLMFLSFLNQLRKRHSARGDGPELSMLERKIESAELLGGYMAKIFFMLIMIYLKVSTLVLEMFRRRRFEPTPAWDIRLMLEPDRADAPEYEDDYMKSDWINDNTDRCYLEPDWRLSCTDTLYTNVFLNLAYIMVLAYPIGIPALFTFLLFRNRDQIHDAIQKMQYGFLFQDYFPKYFWWEVWDLLRKLAISSLMVFFAPGSVMQILTATLFSLGALMAHVRLFPYIFQAANLMQLLALNCILLSLFGALLIKVKKDPTQQENTEWFINTFLLWINIFVPCAIFCAILGRMVLSLYMRSIGKQANKVLGHSARLAMHTLLLNQAKKRGDKEGGCFGRIRRKFIDKCWKTEDIDVLLLAEEALALRQRKIQRDRADIALMHAKVELAEKREWFRFVKNNSSNQKEFNEIIQNESMDTYKRRILGADAVDAEKVFWDSFYGVSESAEKAAFENEAYRRRYTDAETLRVMEAADGDHDHDHLEQYKIQRKEDREEIQDIHDGNHTINQSEDDVGRGGAKGRGTKINVLDVAKQKGLTQTADMMQTADRAQMHADDYEEKKMAGAYDV